MENEIRWQQRFANYQKALLTLTEAVELAEQRPLSNLEQQGLIQGKAILVVKNYSYPG